MRKDPCMAMEHAPQFRGLHEARAIGLIYLIVESLVRVNNCVTVFLINLLYKGEQESRKSSGYRFCSRKIDSGAHALHHQMSNRMTMRPPQFGIPKLYSGQHFVRA